MGKKKQNKKKEFKFQVYFPQKVNRVAFLREEPIIINKKTAAAQFIFSPPF